MQGQDSQAQSYGGCVIKKVSSYMLVWDGCLYGMARWTTKLWHRVCHCFFLLTVSLVSDGVFQYGPVCLCQGPSLWDSGNGGLSLDCNAVYALALCSCCGSDLKRLVQVLINCKCHLQCTGGQQDACITSLLYTKSCTPWQWLSLLHGFCMHAYACKVHREAGIVLTLETTHTSSCLSTACMMLNHQCLHGPALVSLASPSAAAPSMQEMPCQLAGHLPVPYGGQQDACITSLHKKSKAPSPKLASGYWSQS